MQGLINLKIGGLDRMTDGLLLLDLMCASVSRDFEDADSHFMFDHTIQTVSSNDKVT